MNQKMTKTCKSPNNSFKKLEGKPPGMRIFINTIRQMRILFFTIFQWIQIKNKIHLIFNKKNPIIKPIAATSKIYWFSHMIKLYIHISQKYYEVHFFAATAYHILNQIFDKNYSFKLHLKQATRAEK